MWQERAILYDKNQTGNKIKYLIENYYTDLDKIFTKKGKRYIPISKLSLFEFYNMIRKIPYRKDNAPVEVIARPFHIMNHKSMGMDCKKKCIMIGSYLRYHKMPYRIMSSSRRPTKEIHHVFPQVKIGNKWRNLDATYNHNKPLEFKTVTNHEVL